MDAPTRPPRRDTPLLLRRPARLRPVGPVPQRARPVGQGHTRSSSGPSAGMYTLNEWQEDEAAAREARSRALAARAGAAEARMAAGVAWELEKRLSFSSSAEKRLSASSERRRSRLASLDLSFSPESSYPPTPTSPASAASSYPPTPTQLSPTSPTPASPLDVPHLDLDSPSSPQSPEFTPPITPHLVRGVFPSNPHPVNPKEAPPRPRRSAYRDDSPARPPRPSEPASPTLPKVTVTPTTPARPARPPRPTTATAMPTPPTPEAAEIARLRVTNALLRARIGELHARIAILEAARGGVDVREYLDQSLPRTQPSRHTRAVSASVLPLSLSLADEVGPRSRVAPVQKPELPVQVPSEQEPPAQLSPARPAASARTSMSSTLAAPSAPSTSGSTPGSPPTLPSNRASLSSNPRSSRTSLTLAFTPTPLSSVPASPYAASFASGETAASVGTFGRRGPGLSEAWSEEHAGALRKLQGEEQRAR